MNSTAFFNSLMRTFGAADPTSRDPIMLILLLLSFLALYAGVTAISMVRKRNESQDIRDLRLRLQEISLLVEDLNGRIANGKARIDKRTLYLEEKIKLLEAIESQVRHLSKNSQKALDKATSYLEDRVYEIERSVEDISRSKGPSMNFEDDADETIEVQEEVEPMVFALEESDTDDDGRISLLTALGGSRNLFTMKFKQLLEQQGDLGDKMFYAGLQDLLFNSGLGASASATLLEKIKLATNDSPSGASGELIRTAIEKGITKIASFEEQEDITAEKVSGLPKVIVVVGAQGAGKTTVVARLGRYFQKQGGKVLLCSSSSARFDEEVALNELATRFNVDIHNEPASVKPKSVAYKALHRAQDEGYDLLLVDTVALDEKGKRIAEVESVLTMLSREQPNAPHQVLLAVETATGEDVIKQRMQLEDRIHLTGSCITKLDTSKRAGKLVGIHCALNLPIRFVSFGTGAASLEPFSAAEFSYALFYDAGMEFSTDGWEGASA